MLLDVCQQVTANDLKLQFPFGDAGSNACIFIFQTWVLSFPLCLLLKCSCSLLSHSFLPLLPLVYDFDDGIFFLFKQLYDVMRLGFFSPALIEELLSEGIHHGVTNFHGLLHLNVLAIHSVVDHQHT